jgi:hypothetical protein
MLTLTRTQNTIPARAPARARRTARTAQSARVIARARTSAVVEDEFATDDDVVRRGQVRANDRGRDAQEFDASRGRTRERARASMDARGRRSDRSDGGAIDIWINGARWKTTRSVER